MKISKQILAAFLLSHVPDGVAWQSNNLQRRVQRNRLSVASRDLEDVETKEKVPYAISRGDGSTGGGGLPMPHVNEGEEGLARPKVGAPMPEG